MFTVHCHYKIRPFVNYMFKSKKKILTFENRASVLKIIKKKNQSKLTSIENTRRTIID